MPCIKYQTYNNARESQNSKWYIDILFCQYNSNNNMYNIIVIEFYKTFFWVHTYRSESENRYFFTTSGSGLYCLYLSLLPAA